MRVRKDWQTLSPAGMRMASNVFDEGNEYRWTDRLKETSGVLLKSSPSVLVYDDV